MTLARTLLLGLATSSALVLATPAAAQLAAWDQARVTSIGKQLADAADAWELAIREQPGGEIGSGDADQQFGLVNKARVIREQSRALADHLAKGDGYDKTRDLYRDLKEVMDDTEVIAQRSELDEPTMDAWSKLVDLQRQIAPYYDTKASQETMP
jgi:hypothetical protein